MMKKLKSILLASVLILGGIGTLAINSNNSTVDARNICDKLTINFETPTLKEDDSNYIRFVLGQEELYIMNPGQPMLPRILKIIELPFGVQNIKIDLLPSEIQEITIKKEIRPAPAAIPLSPIEGYVSPPKKDTVIYNSSSLYPSSWYSYHVGCGLNSVDEHVTFVTINLYPLRYIPATGKIYALDSATITLTYDNPKRDILPLTSEYDLVIIAPAAFTTDLQTLIDHKNNHDVKTILKTAEEIYEEYTGVDEPEQIKYFIKDALETWGIKYVLLVGGLKSLLYAKPRDHDNYGATGWHLPVRYSNLISGEPGYLCDLYYADIYKENGEFDNWDSNGNGIFAEWTHEDDPPEDILDLYPDVALGRLACRNNKEVQDIVNKIITYESSSYDSDWFHKMIVISGDGFLDQEDLDIQWNTSGLPDGEYTIYAQSTNPDGETGPRDTLTIQLDRTHETRLSFNHDDHLNPALENGYPAPPIAEIVSVSDGDILGNTDYTYTPTDGEAYCNELFWWANISYVKGILHIRGKSYDPQAYGNLTDITVWIENSNGEIVFQDYRNDTKTYYEGEWVTGGKSLHGRGGALYYMPEDFEQEFVWTSNGEFTGQDSVIEAYSQGFGFAFFSGHGSPGWWGDHFPGIPGNRQYAQVAGLTVSQVRPYFPFFTPPFFPMNQLSNTDKLPVVVVGGCHNSMFSVSLLPTFLEFFFVYLLGIPLYMHTYGQAIPECWGWYMVKLPDTGAIATMGNTGYGWGWEGEWCTIGAGDGWITSEFFRQYGEKGHDVLGTSYSQTLTSYISNFRGFTLPECGWSPDYGWDWIDEKTVQQWVLLGDPSLQIGGYP